MTVTREFSSWWFTQKGRLLHPVAVQLPALEVVQEIDPKSMDTDELSIAWLVDQINDEIGSRCTLDVLIKHYKQEPQTPWPAPLWRHSPRSIFRISIRISADVIFLRAWHLSIWIYYWWPISRTMQAWNPKTHVPVPVKKQNWVVVEEINCTIGSRPRDSFSTFCVKAESTCQTSVDCVTTCENMTLTKLVKIIRITLSDFQQYKTVPKHRIFQMQWHKDKGPPLSQTSLPGGKDPAVLAVLMRSQLHAFHGIKSIEIR